LSRRYYYRPDPPINTETIRFSICINALRMLLKGNGIAVTDDEVSKAIRQAQESEVETVEIIREAERIIKEAQG
jgi:hypothetical protein